MSEADVVEYHWGETNGHEYRRGSRPEKSQDAPTPCANTPDVPWTWGEDGMKSVWIQISNTPTGRIEFFSMLLGGRVRHVARRPRSA